MTVWNVKFPCFCLISVQALWCKIVIFIVIVLHGSVVVWLRCSGYIVYVYIPLDSEKSQGWAASRIFKIRPLVAEILHILWWGILFWATLYIYEYDHHSNNLNKQMCYNNILQLQSVKKTLAINKVVTVLSLFSTGTHTVLHCHHILLTAYIWIQNMLTICSKTWWTFSWKLILFKLSWYADCCKLS